MSHSNEDGSSPFLKSSLGKRKLGRESPVSPQASHEDNTGAEQPTNGSTETAKIPNDSPHDVPSVQSVSSDAQELDGNFEKDSRVWWSDGPDERNIHIKPSVAAIFIHAGAGYHSTANERLHLDACSDAARAAMKLLKMGVPAVDGVEAAIKVLEDREITNAGFGSNLAMDGTVECDATLVDHYGRSGACGATPNIKNPISLAKLILVESHKALSLRRVPPNLLIGEGAKDFAVQHGMPLVPNDWLVSRNAFDRYERWAKELKTAEDAVGHSTSRPEVSSPTNDSIPKGREKRDHTNAIATGTWNEGQPDSPAPPTPSDISIMPMTSSPLKALPPVLHKPSSPRNSIRVSTDRSPLSFLGSLTSPKSNSPANTSASPTSKKPRVKRGMSKDGESEMDTGDGPSSVHSPQSDHDISDIATQDLMFQEDEDKITDTVGAIAIDQWGNMAAGSSSGGIGMKHIGRIGPAALVGIGTALIPRPNKTGRSTNEHESNSKDQNNGPDPSDWKAVAVVTSGTGEHMAISQASQKCAERLYFETKRGADGNDVHEEDETILMESFVAQDFQKHPGVLRSPSASAIGAMAVKQTAKGYYLFFAHNTDSFALASMSSNDRQPHCVMSRLGEGSVGVAHGSRKIAPS